MSVNPYQLPSNSSIISDPMPPPSKKADYQYRPTVSLTNVLSALLIVSAVCSLGLAAADLVGYLLVPGYEVDDFELAGLALAVVGGLLIFGLGGVFIFLATAITFLVWTHRVTVNAFALGADELRGTPGWSVAYWIIPIVNLFRPYQHFCQIARAATARGSDHWASVAVPAFFLPWWLSWVIGNVLSRIEFRAEFSDLDLGVAAMPLAMASSALTIASALLAMKVVRYISAAQQTRATLLTNSAGDALPGSF